MQRYYRSLPILNLLLALFLVPGAAHAQQAGVRWDIIHIPSFNPVDVQPGGQASAATFSDGTKLTLTGSGTFVPSEPDQVTGGGTWTIADPTGKVLGTGTYQVTDLLKYNETQGGLPATFRDQIGRNEDFRVGLAFLRIAYSDGGRGILVISSRDDLLALPAGAATAAATMPAMKMMSLFTGITASKDAQYYGARVAAQPGVDGNRVALHAVVVP
jgi:hypothetical protein